jgi:hypothetical protein
MSDIDPAILLHVALQFSRSIESGRGAELWGRASAVVGDSVDAQTFCENVLSQRARLGSITSRRWARLDRYRSDGDAGTPAGTYASAVFDLQFDSGHGRQETIALRFDEDGVWRLVGYWIG